MTRTIACALLAALLVVACAPTKQQRFNLTGYSEAFKAGHADGCASAGGRMQRDERRFRGDADYMMGWNDGRSACK